MSRSGQDDPPSQAAPRTSRAMRRPTIPGYELLEKLGEGGMGVVYLARQTGLNRMVAVKMIRGGQQARPEHFARFRIEAEAVAQLRHPNILQIYEIGEVDDLPFVSLELLEGGSLADRLDGTPQPGRQAAELMVTLAGAVQAAHEAGIVHRDLKPLECPVHRGRPPQDHRLRAGQADGVGQPADRVGPDHGLPQLHGPRAGPRPHEGRGPGRGRLCPGGDPLRDAHRPPSVQGRDARWRRSAR